VLSKSYAIVTVCALLALIAGALVGWRFAIFILPFSWTGEHTHLADFLHVKSGSVVADIGAGDGSLAVEMARLVGRDGLVYATELSADQQQAISTRVSQAGTPQVRVVQARLDATNLPDGCCDAVYMRTVFHHITNHAEFARQVAKAVRPGGRLAVIDFAPGALWFLGGDHGVAAEDVAQAFHGAGLRLIQRVEKWGGGMYLLLFERGARSVTMARRTSSRRKDVTGAER
jgi:ubiquinone/menaquinone biosynthesis C-methylase UbiE